MRVVVLLLLFLGPGVHAQVYRGVDRDGQTVFSDRPLPNAEQLDLPLRRAAEEAAADVAGAEARGALDAGFAGPYDLLDIVAPENDHRSRDASGELPLSLVIAPSLLEGHQLVVEVDGVAATGELPNPTQILLRGLSLGTHRIRAVVRDTNSVVLAATRTITVHLLRPLPDAAQP